MKQGCRVTPGGGDPRESATEKSLPGFARVMVKRWGKSPPRTGQPGRHGKPHPEQCRIGASRGKVRPMPSGGRRPPQGRFSPEARVGSLTAAATRAAEEWSSKGGNPRDRIRLTGHPRVSFWLAWQRGPCPLGAAPLTPAGIYAKVKTPASSWLKYPGGPGGTPGGAKRRRPRRRPERLARAARAI